MSRLVARRHQGRREDRVPRAAVSADRNDVARVDVGGEPERDREAGSSGQGVEAQESDSARPEPTARGSEDA